MARIPIIKNNKVIDVIELEENSTWKSPEGIVIGPEGGEIGDSYDSVDKVYIKPDLPVLPIDKRRLNKMIEIDNRSQEIIKEGFTYDSELFSLSDRAQGNWAALLSAINASLISLPHEISTINEKVYMITSTDFFTSALGAVDAPLKLGRALKVLVSISDNPESIKDNR